MPRTNMHSLQCYTEGMIGTAGLGRDEPAAALASEALHLGAHFGRRDRKKQATRRALRNAALELVAERGFAHVTVEDIAEAADVATRTFFNYFPSKESAVIGADPERIEELRTNLLTRPAEEKPLDALGFVLVAYTATIDEDFDAFGEGKRTWFHRFCAVRADPELLHAYAAHMAEIETNLADAVAQRLGTDLYHDPYPALVTAAALAAARVAAMYWSTNGGEDSLARLTSIAIEGLSGGLLPEKAVLGTPTDLSGRPRRRLGPSAETNSEKSEER